MLHLGLPSPLRNCHEHATKNFFCGCRTFEYLIFVPCSSSLSHPRVIPFIPLSVDFCGKSYLVMTSVPQPFKLPLLGNLLNLDPKTPIVSLQDLADTYGECYRLDTPRSSTVVVNTQELLNEICDHKRFHKEPTGALLEARNGVGDAMFTAYQDEESWEVAHRILLPKFAPHSVKLMFSGKSLTSLAFY